MPESKFTGPALKQEFTWKHVEPTGDKDFGAEINAFDLPNVVSSALIATETRPRCDRIGGGALINLRGISSSSETDNDRLVSIRMWVEHRQILTVSRKPLEATDIVRKEMAAGHLTDTGDVVAAFAKAISGGLDPRVAAMGDLVDDCESEIEETDIYELRRKIAAIRTEAISYRRFVAPNRDALLALAELNLDWLAEEDRLHIREAADRFARMTEELESIRERAALLHEQLTDMRSELIDQRSLMIAVVAFIFLPLTFITGLLGMNVKGIPFATEPWAFWGIVIACVLIGLAVLGWFGVRNWLSK